MSHSQIDWKSFLKFFGIMRGHCAYGLGAKASSLGESPTLIHQCDCSGWARYMIYNCAGGLIIPDGSWVQREWCEANLEQVPYGAATNDLIIAFMTAGVNGTGNIGHVWFVKDGATYECHGGTGVDSRPWDHASLKDHVHKAFRFPLKAALQGYNLIASDKHEMATLKIIDGHNYVKARNYADWYKLPIAWQAPKVLLNNIEISDVKLINENGTNWAYVPFVEAAQTNGITYIVDNAKREIRLQPVG